MQKNARIYSDSVRENHQVIFAAMSPYLQNCTRVLEIASGSGEHAKYFAEQLSNLKWQPSDHTDEALASITAWREASSLENFSDPLRINVLDANWSITEAYDAIVNINMIHISPWECTSALFSKAKQHLNPNGFVLLYGPYFFRDRENAESNRKFDEWLKHKNPAFGVRYLEDVKDVAANNNFNFKELIPMPRDNCTVIFQRD